MCDEGVEPQKTSASLRDWRMAACEMLRGCLTDRPALVSTLARAALTDDDGAVMGVGEALDNQARTVVPLLLDHLHDLMLEVDGHFREVDLISTERALVMDSRKVEDILCRERGLLLPAVKVAEVLAEMLGDRGRGPLGDCLAYRASGENPDGPRASHAVTAITRVAVLVEREIAGAFPGRGMPKEQLWLDEGDVTGFGPFLDEGDVTGFGPFLGLAPDERDGLIDFLNSQVLVVKSQRAIIRGLNLSSAFVHELPEYDPDSMGGLGFLPERQVDGLARIGAWAEISWRRLARSCRRYEEATVLLGGVCGRERSENAKMGTCKAVVESPSYSLPAHVAEVDVSMMLRSGSEARVLDPCGPDSELGSVSVWTAAALGEGAALLVGSLADETDAEEAAEHLERWRWLSTFKDAPEVRMGMAPLTERNLLFLGVGVGDELTVVGFGDHIEIWNPVRWDEETSDFEEELLNLLEEYVAVSDDEEC